MKISFNISYHTQWGESLFICGDILQMGGGDAAQALEMRLTSPDSWVCDIELDSNPGDFNYFFIVKSPDKAWRFEWGKPHLFKSSPDLDNVKIFDCWQDLPSDKPYYSSAFVDGILLRECHDMVLASLPGTMQFRVCAPMVYPDEVLAIAGEGDYLGNWNPDKALHLNDANFPEWTINLPLSEFSEPFQYKFLIVKKDTGKVVEWENIDNRRCGFINEAPDCQIVVDGLRFASPANDWKGAGTAIPVFSIRTDDDFGIGDFCDIKKMVDWCKRTGQKVLQLLPINDTTKLCTWIDSYPYNANSSFALHPMYLRPEAIGMLNDEGRREHFRKIAIELNELTQIDYEAVNEVKNQYFREIFAQNGERDLKTDEFISFFAHNESWLKPYAVWRVLRDEYQTPDNSQWGEFAEYNADKVEEYCNLHSDGVRFHFFLQFHLDRQLREARDYAHLNGVVLKGDIPIGVSRFSADAWQFPRLFNMDCQAGAPPDDFSVLGQNWGFPTYNWDEMAVDGFQWWKDRFRKMTEYFDAYRIDHILGFFRIWQIPMEAVHGLLGYFNPALPFSAEELRHNYDFWIDADVQTSPLILEWMLTDFFGEYTDEVKKSYLVALPEGRYKLSSFVSTQKKVLDYFSTLEKTDKNTRICNALMGLIDDVLFIEDPYQKGHYHPRIAAQYSYQYRMLTDYEKWCFNRLYNDFFYHRHNDFWYGKAMWNLPPLTDSTGMLTCAEDLGMIPDCVPEVMSKLEILSLEIQRMPKDPALEFGDTWHYPYYSVCTTSTHDMGGIRVWWEADRNVTQRFFNNALHQEGTAPLYAEPWICEKILRLNLDSPSMFCIIPLADWLSADGELRRQNPHDEQINEPSNSQHYWRYRMHISAERLLSSEDFNQRLYDAIKVSGR